MAPASSLAALEPLWVANLFDPLRLELGGKEFGQPAFARDGKILVVADRMGMVRAFDSKKGGVLWTRDLGDPISSPITPLDDQRALILTGGGFMHVLNLDDGSDDWKETRKTQGGYHSAPLVHGPLIVAIDDANRVLAVTRDGRFVFDVGIRTPGEFSLFGEATPVTDGKRIFVGFAEGTVAALDPIRGSRIWEYSLEAETTRASDAQAGPVIRGDRLYVGSTQSGLVALDTKDGRKLGQVGLPGLVQMVDAPSGEVYAFSWDQKVYRLEFSDKVAPRVTWVVKGNGAAGRPALTESLLLYCNGDGLVALDRASGVARAIRRVGGGCSGGVATAPGRAAHILDRGSVVVWRVYGGEGR